MFCSNQIMKCIQTYLNCKLLNRGTCTGVSRITVYSVSYCLMHTCHLKYVHCSNPHWSSHYYYYYYYAAVEMSEASDQHFRSATPLKINNHFKRVNNSRTYLDGKVYAINLQLQLYKSSVELMGQLTLRQKIILIDACLPFTYARTHTHGGSLSTQYLLLSEQKVQHRTSTFVPRS